MPLLESLKLLGLFYKLRAFKKRHGVPRFSLSWDLLREEVCCSVRRMWCVNRGADRFFFLGCIVLLAFVLLNGHLESSVEALYIRVLME
jgi:hypothetical protein